MFPRGVGPVAATAFVHYAYAWMGRQRATAWHRSCRVAFCVASRLYVEEIPAGRMALHCGSGGARLVRTSCAFDAIGGFGGVEGRIG